MEPEKRWIAMVALALSIVSVALGMIREFIKDNPVPLPAPSPTVLIVQVPSGAYTTASPKP